MKSWVSILIGLVVAVGAIVWAVMYSPPAGEEPLANTTTDDQTTVSVYFDNTQQNPNAADCAAVYPVPRRVAADNQIQDAVQALFAGPTDTEKANGYTSFFSSASADSVLSVEVENDVAYVNLLDIRMIMPNASTSCGSAQFLASVEKTLRQFSAVTDVVLAINGDPRTLYEWLQLECPAASNNCDTAPFGGSGTNTNGE